MRALRRPPGTGYAWGGGEHAWIQELDTCVGELHGIDAEHRSLTAYRRRNRPTNLR